MNRYNGVPSDAPEGGFLHSIKDNFNQEWSESYVGRGGVGNILHDSQNEFYNGEFSGSNITVTIGDLNPNNPYNDVNYQSEKYKTYLFSAAGNRHIQEGTFLNQNTQPDNGEIYLYYITNSVPSPIIDDSPLDNFAETGG